MLTIEPLDYHDDGDYWFSRIVDLPFACWLDSGKPLSNYGRYDIISALPDYRLITQCKETTLYRRQGFRGAEQKVLRSSKDPLALLHEQLNHISPENSSHIPFTGGAIGFFSYDLGRRYVPLDSRSITLPRQFPDMHVGIYSWAIIQDHQLKKSWLVSQPECDPDLLIHVKQRLTQLTPVAIDAFSVAELQPQISQNHYLEQFERIREYIYAGDCYQVNFAQAFKGRYHGNPYHAYQKLRQLMASPFSGFLSLENSAILSLSPERFLRVKQRQVLTQPIKGTTPRATQPEIDHQNAMALQKSEKNRAENLMIVDLLRNDLGHSCVPGSIQVEKLFNLESFPNVHHLVSDISGTLTDDSDSLSLFSHCFPGGSITGAPKRRAMEIIDELESGHREIYCGSIGYISSNGDMDTNIAIRTVTCHDQQITCWGGGGIVADSDPLAEYQESLDKISTILAALTSKG